MSSLTAAVDLPVTASTVRDARAITLGVVASWTSGVSREDLTLLVDDLTADVVDHAEGESSLVLELTLDEELLRVGLADGSAVRPVAEDIPGVGPSWALAERWGEEPYRGGHRVWFELRPLPVPGGADEPGDADAPLTSEALRDALAVALGTTGRARPSGRWGGLRRTAAAARAGLARVVELRLRD